MEGGGGGGVAWRWAMVRQRGTVVEKRTSKLDRIVCKKGETDKSCKRERKDEDEEYDKEKEKKHWVSSTSCSAKKQAAGPASCPCGW